MCSLLCNQFSTLFITVACGSRCCEILYSLAKLPNFISFLIAILLSKQAHTHTPHQKLLCFLVYQNLDDLGQKGFRAKHYDFFVTEGLQPQDFSFLDVLNIIVIHKLKKVQHCVSVLQCMSH